MQLDPSVREAPGLAWVVAAESGVNGSGITQSEPHIHAGEVRLVHTLRAAQARQGNATIGARQPASAELDAAEEALHHYNDVVKPCILNCAQDGRPSCARGLAIATAVMRAVG